MSRRRVNYEYRNIDHAHSKAPVSASVMHWIEADECELC